MSHLENILIFIMKSQTGNYVEEYIEMMIGIVIPFTISKREKANKYHYIINLSLFSIAMIKLSNNRQTSSTWHIDDVV
jgi:hypothetical protein